MAVTKTSYYLDDYKVEVFTGHGSTNWTVPSGVTSIDYLVVGGGSGAGWYAPLINLGSKYGKAGEVKEGTTEVTPEAVHSITVGKGSDNGLKVWNESLGWTWLASNAGGNSSIGSLVVASGGTASNSSTNGYTAKQRAGKSGTFWERQLLNVGAGGYTQEELNGVNGVVFLRYLYPLVVTTDGASSIDDSSFTMTGSITNGDATVRGFCYFEGSSGNPTTYDSTVDEEGTFTADEFSLDITGLTGNSNFRVRAFATNAGGTSYGETIQVCTDCVDGNNGVTTWTELAYFEYTSTVFRGGIVAGDELYIVLGDRVLYITASGAVGYIGQLTTTTGFVSMAFNGIDILVVDGSVHGRYITKASKTWNEITHADFPAASSCTFIDGYFVVTKANSGEFYVSDLYDASTWDALRYATAEGKPDVLYRCLNANNSLWLIGGDTSEVWYNTGNVDFPFSRIQGAVIEDGAVGPTAVTVIKDQIYFLSNKLEVMRTVGYQRQKISTIHIDTAIQGYSKTNDAITFSYAVDGHIFFVLTFPTVDKTWVYDITTQAWHEWESYKEQGVATYGRHRANDVFYFNDKYYACDYYNGNIYEIDPNTYSDNGEPIRRIRRTQFIDKDKKNISHHEIVLEFELIDNIEYETDPTVGLRYSDDNTNSWSVYRYNSLPRIGVFNPRLVWRRLGKSRSRIYELSTSARCRFLLVGASAVLEDFKE